MDGIAEVRTLGGNPDESKKPGREGSPAFSADPGLLRRGIDGAKPCPSCVIIPPGQPVHPSVYCLWPGKPESERRPGCWWHAGIFFGILRWKYCPSRPIVSLKLGRSGGS